MGVKKFILDPEEAALLAEIERGEWHTQPMNEDERVRYAEYAQYTKSLNEKKQATIRYPSACS